MTEPAKFLGIDVGGTRIKGIAVDASGRILAEESTPTEDSAAGRWRDNVRSACERLQQRVPGIAAAGLCAPGLAARDERSIARMPGRMHGIEGFAWDRFLGLPTAVLNDAHAALVGEAWLGAARGVDNVLLLTLGTGVGGAAIVDGRLLRGHLGRAGHFGHVSLDPAGPGDAVGTPGSLEDAIGDLTVRARSGGRFSDTLALTQAAQAGDAEARRVWEDSLRALAAAIVSLINALDPQRIVIGGGIAQAGDALFAPLRAHVARHEWRPAGHTVALVAAQLGAHAGALGAARHALLRFHST